MTGQTMPSVGGHQTLSGGTRTKVKTVRPWQVRMPCPETEEMRADCPFCSREQQDKHMIARGWKTFQNSNTPFPYHRLLVPDVCWPEKKLWSLGGNMILENRTYLLGLMLRMAISEVKRTRGELWPIWIYIHVGYGAGQNFPHPHWHLCGAPTEPKPLFEKGKLPEGSEILFVGSQFTSVLCGVRAGQVAIVPLPKAKLDTWKLVDSFVVEELANEAMRVIELFNEKFDRPDYCLFLALNSPTDWHVRYTPILNNWGGSEFAALDYGTPFVEPWRHKDTLEHLLGTSSS